ncbi:RecA RecA/RadA recombinase [uncultured Caudovirales phage]|uniref:RecA RecA/RadA recombinase n=1 Tax=uncultured Caudovirales phage TaxID=2100421 RepID=A0A6J5LYG6_9CAUD|nr:RecA RecA/RadA recombinase [uncultured Caudovirales phage]CAB4148053.1 RecA RecA/RadA recombinase [uncultured Caudovirales phage]
MINADALKVMAQLNKRFGGDTIVIGGNIRNDLIKRATTGSTTFDYILGGGFPTNQWNELIGEPSHGKTAIALKTIAANQKLDAEYTTVWVAAEQWVPEYAEMAGVDTSRVIVIETNIMEEAYDVVIAFAESKSVDAIVIDSLPALVPSPENEKNMDEMTVGRGALITNKFFRKAGAAMKRSLTESERPILGLIINQYRMKIGVMHGDPRTTPGGQGKDYAFFTRSEVRRDEWIEAGTGVNKTRVGQRIKIRTLKNKTAPPSRTAYVDFYFADHSIYSAGDYDVAKEVAAMAIVKQIVDRKGGWIYYGERKWQGQEALVNSLREEVDFFDELRDKVLTTPDSFVGGTDSDE